MVNKGIDHENDLQCNACTCLVLTILQWNIKPILLIISSCYCKKTNRPDFFMGCTLNFGECQICCYSECGVGKCSGFDSVPIIMLQCYCLS